MKFYRYEIQNYASFSDDENELQHHYNVITKLELHEFEDGCRYDNINDHVNEKTKGMLIDRMNVHGYFIDTETAKEISQFLEDYYHAVSSRLKDKLDDEVRREILINTATIERIRQKIEKDDEFS